MMLQVAIFMYKATAFGEFRMDDIIPLRKSTQISSDSKACYTYREPFPNPFRPPLYTPKGTAEPMTYKSSCSAPMNITE